MKQRFIGSRVYWVLLGLSFLMVVVGRVIVFTTGNAQQDIIRPSDVILVLIFILAALVPAMTRRQ